MNEQEFKKAIKAKHRRDKNIMSFGLSKDYIEYSWGNVEDNKKRDPNKLWVPGSAVWTDTFGRMGKGDCPQF